MQEDDLRRKMGSPQTLSKGREKDSHKEAHSGARDQPSGTKVEEVRERRASNQASRTALLTMAS